MFRQSLYTKLMKFFLNKAFYDNTFSSYKKDIQLHDDLMAMKQISSIAHKQRDLSKIKQLLKYKRNGERKLLSKSLNKVRKV